MTTVKPYRIALIQSDFIENKAQETEFTPTTVYLDDNQADVIRRLCTALNTQNSLSGVTIAYFSPEKDSK